MWSDKHAVTVSIFTIVQIHGLLIRARVLRDITSILSNRGKLALASFVHRIPVWVGEKYPHSNTDLTAGGYEYGSSRTTIVTDVLRGRTIDRNLATGKPQKSGAAAQRSWSPKGVIFSAPSYLA
jgi:hypothetical protein